MGTLTYLKKEIVSLLFFAKKPVFSKSNKSFSKKILSFITIFAINIAIAFLLTSSYSLLSKFGYEKVLSSNKIPDLFNSFSPFFIGSLLIIIVPLIEEFVFRLQLKFRKWVLDILFPLQVSFIVYAISFFASININFLVINLICYVAYFFLNKKYPNKLQQFWEIKFHYVFYILTLLFALIHITNYNLTSSLIFILPILILPQFIVGTIIGYLRVKFGFFWGVLYHIIYNAVFILPLISNIPNNSQKLSINNQSYKLTINENNQFNKNNKVLHTSLDSVYIDNYSLKECISLLSDKEIKQVKTNNQLKEKTKLTISYRTKSNSNNANQYKTEIINELQKLYNFDIIKESEESLLNKIIITDSLKFNQKSSYNNDYVKKSFNSKYIDIKNGKVHDLIASFNKMYRDSFFYSTIDSKRRLSIKIEKMPMNELIILLEKDYGLSIVKSKGNNSIYKIIFN